MILLLILWCCNGASVRDTVKERVQSKSNLSPACPITRTSWFRPKGQVKSWRSERLWFGFKGPLIMCALADLEMRKPRHTRVGGSIQTQQGMKSSKLVPPMQSKWMTNPLESQRKTLAIRRIPWKCENTNNTKIKTRRKCCAITVGKEEKSGETIVQKANATATVKLTSSRILKWRRRRHDKLPLWGWNQL